MDRALTPLLVVLVMVGLGVSIAWNIRPVQGPYAELRSIDPRIGQAISWTKEQARIVGAKEWLLLYVGSCSSCAVNTLDVVALSKNARRPLLIVTTSQPDSWPASWRAHGITTIVDADNAPAPQLNILWTPRSYVIDKRGCVISISQKPGNMPEKVS